MIRFTFEATFEDGTPRRFAGTHRPSFASIRGLSKKADGEHVFYNESRSQLWMEGRFDVPLYHLEEDET